MQEDSAAAADAREVARDLGLRAPLLRGALVALPVPSLVVFDDCHRIPADSPFFEMLRDGISRLGSGVGTVLISRSDPPPCFSRKRANREMQVLGWNDLRLDLREAAGIVRLLRKGLPPVAVRELLERTDGWVAGLVLLLQRSHRPGPEAPRTGQPVPAEIIEYFGSEIFGRLDDGTKRFLMRSAFLPRMTSSMAEQLSGGAPARRILSDLNRQNLFTERSSQQDPVYEYHALFREFLVEQARYAWSAGELAEIRTRAAALLEEGGHVEDAVPLLREARDWERLARSVVRTAGALVAQGRHRTVLEWIAALPPEIRDAEPALAYWTAVALTPSSPAQSRPLFEKAFAGFEHRQDIEGVFRSWTGVVDSCLASLGDWSALDAWIPLLSVLLGRNGGFPSDEIREQATPSFFTALLYCRPAGVDIDAWAERTLEVMRNTPDANLKIKCGVSFFLYKLGRGGFQEAQRSLATFRDLVGRPNARPLGRLWVDWMDAALSIFLARPERSVRVATEGLAFAKQVGVHFVDPLLLGYAALGALHLGDRRTADALVAELKASVGLVPPVAPARRVPGCVPSPRRGELGGVRESRSTVSRAPARQRESG